MKKEKSEPHMSDYDLMKGIFRGVFLRFPAKLSKVEGNKMFYKCCMSHLYFTLQFFEKNVFIFSSTKII